ncbi:hypothetical protein C8J56DRAFT_947502, partial [Mycena floridula]
MVDKDTECLSSTSEEDGTSFDASAGDSTMAESARDQVLFFLGPWLEQRPVIASFRYNVPRLGLLPRHPIPRRNDLPSAPLPQRQAGASGCTNAISFHGSFNRGAGYGILGQLITDLDALLSFSLGASLSAFLVSSHFLSCFIALSCFVFLVVCSFSSGLRSSCCDSTTCKYTSGSVCDPLNSACYTDQCDFAPRGQICRPSKDAQCDQPEMCTGTTATCPADAMAAN